jgi:hypothetical protein
MTEKKIVAYLSTVILEDDEPLDKLTQETYAYTYKYTSVARRDANGKYVGNCECYFTCLNNGYKFVQKDNGVPIMWTNTKNLTLIRNAWKICLKLANLITNKDLENDSFVPEMNDYEIYYSLKKMRKNYVTLIITTGVTIQIYQSFIQKTISKNKVIVGKFGKKLYQQ